MTEAARFASEEEVVEWLRVAAGGEYDVICNTCREVVTVVKSEGGHQATNEMCKNPARFMCVLSAVRSLNSSLTRQAKRQRQ